MVLPNRAYPDGGAMLGGNEANEVKDKQKGRYFM